MKKNFLQLTLQLTILFSLVFPSCKSAKVEETLPAVEISEPEPELLEETASSQEPDAPLISDTITLLFAGDIMAHSVNYYISDYPKIWRDVKDIITPADLSFANIEAPIDTTKSSSSWPNFNMTKGYVEAAIDAGFDVFSLCNNHTNDQGLNGIKETMKTTTALTTRSLERNEKIYFSGLKNGSSAKYSYNIIEKNGWTILFLPMTELLNRPEHSDYINFVKPKEKERKAFIEYCKTLRAENPCDLFVLSFHTAEPEYTRKVTETQDKFYRDLLDAGVDIIWANHAHIIKDRRIIINSETQQGKIIMYANGNTISGQRTSPDFTSSNPTGERDNTGDGLFYIVTLFKDDDNIIHIKKCQNIFVTTYINTADEYVVKPLNQEFVKYLYDVPRTNWAKYIEKRIKINNEYTKDYIEWQ